jgi:hypothetical protein
MIAIIVLSFYNLEIIKMSFFIKYYNLLIRLKDKVEITEGQNVIRKLEELLDS